MGKRMILRSPLPVFIGIISAILFAGLPGCGYLRLYTRQSALHAIVETTPRMSMLNRYAPGNSLLLCGKIVQTGQRKEPLLLAAVSSQYKPNEIVAMVTLQGPYYALFLPKGDYALFVFADLNQNGYFERNELIGQEMSVILAPNQSGSGNCVVESPPITVDFDNPGKTVFRFKVRVRDTSYIYASLDDDFFDPEYGDTGLYNPANLMAHTQGFIFGLEEFDEKKTMVLFVHGSSGTPRDWKYFAEGLDRSRFQPFFLYYPSGLPLDKLGSLLAQVVDTIDKNTVNSNHKIVLAAHSMGGLVALSAINQLSTDRPFPASLKMYVSFSTPYGGDDSARKWLDTAPVMVPAWRDIAAGSAFLQELDRRQIPKALPFHLFFSYNDPSTLKLGESRDGAVTLRSQLAPVQQAAAVRLYGFNETHNGILASQAAREAFFRLLDSVSPRPTVSNAQ